MSRVLFLCTGNSARSILGEFILRSLDPHTETLSAGSQPKGVVHALAIRVLRERYGIDASSASSKSAAGFLEQPIDLVITVCDHARDTCPLWPGAGLVVHWGQEDPAAVEGSEAVRLAAFEQAAAIVERRCSELVRLLADGSAPRHHAAALRAIGST